MRALKNLLGIAVILSIVQTSLQAEEVSVEDSYLQQSVEIMVIQAQAQSLDRDNKFIALEYIRELIDNGSTGDDVRRILQSLATEGILNKVQSEGRLANNFPDVRVKAVEYLGFIKSQASVDALVKVMLTDTEPSVLTAAVNSLKQIDINENDDTVNYIAFTFDKQNARHPNNVLAVAVINALKNFADQGSKSPEIRRIIMSLSVNSADYVGYANNVRDYAGKVLAQIRASGK